MGLIILRAVFVMVASGVGVWLLSSGVIPQDQPWMSWVAFLGVLLTALGVIAVDVAIPRKKLDSISAVYFGLIVGLFLAYVGSLALTPLYPSPLEDAFYAMKVRGVVQLVLAVVLCYVCISLLMQTKDDFRFIIPYVEFAKEAKGRQPYMLDTSVVIDGRIADVVETHVLRQPAHHAAVRRSPSCRRSPTAPTARAAAAAGAAWTSSTGCGAIPRSTWRSTTATCPSSPASRST